jgi:ABC-type lipoprotein release transport system permease subunit
MSEDDFRNVFGVAKDFATDIVISVKNAKERPTVTLKMAMLFPDTRQILREEILRTYDAVFDWRSGMMIVILSASLLAFLILAWDKASGLGPDEKREIGILKAIGWETSDVLLMKLWEGMVISLTALLAGILLAYAHVYFASAFIFESALKGWSVLYPRFAMTPNVNPFELTVIFFITVVPYTVMTIVPAWRAATVDPDSMMR